MSAAQTNSFCARCGASFSCGMADQGGDAPCWCVSIPPIPREVLERYAPSGAACLCPACLRLLAESSADQGS